MIRPWLKMLVLIGVLLFQVAATCADGGGGEPSRRSAAPVVDQGYGWP